MKCPFCHFHDTKVLDSRMSEEGDCIKRRRKCPHCGRRFITYERYEAIPLMVIKKDLRRELFDRKKILSGITKACEKRPISMHQIEQISLDIEQKITNSNEREISSMQIGRMVMDYLKKIDEVAYIRFASVYKEFKDISKFTEELKHLKNDKKKQVIEQSQLPLE